MKTLTLYIKNKILNAYKFSRGNIAIYEGKYGRYTMYEDGGVYFRDYETDYHGSKGEYLGRISFCDQEKL